MGEDRTLSIPLRELTLSKTSLRKKYVCDISAAAAAKSLHLCPTLCDPIDGRPPGSPVPGIPPARTLEWVAIAFSNVTFLPFAKISLSARVMSLGWSSLI